MTMALAALVVTAIALPHVLRLERVVPSLAIAIWGSALALRALTVIFGLAYVVFVLPQTDAFAAVTHWCWHTILPLMATHLGLDGHSIGDAAVLGASFVVAASAVSVGFGLARAGRSVRRMLNRETVGIGPQASLIVGGPEVMLAAAGFTRPRVVVSAGALAVLDDEELAAGLDHERGHIERRHRFVLVIGELCRGVARFMPGTRQALSQLTFHVERDADQWALARRHDRLALASAICKAATFRSASPVLSTLGSCGVRGRLDQLLDGSAGRSEAMTSSAIRVIAVAMVAFTITTTVAGATATVAAAAYGGPSEQLRHCPD